MPAGDLLAVDGQLELRALLQGADTPFTVSRRAGGIQGLFGNTVKANDVDLDAADGGYASGDWASSKLITAPLLIKQSTPDLLEDMALLLEAAWEPSRVDLQLHFQWWGRGHFYVVGRPRGLTVIEDLTIAGHRVYAGLFKALDPTITYVP